MELPSIDGICHEEEAQKIEQIFNCMVEGIQGHIWLHPELLSFLLGCAEDIAQLSKYEFSVIFEKVTIIFNLEN